MVTLWLMYECQMYARPPFSIEDVKSINSFQKLSEFFSRLACKCGGEQFATERGLTCRKCNDTYDGNVPLFIVNGTWNKFRKKVEPEEDGID